jgi:hypothetical protein
MFDIAALFPVNNTNSQKCGHTSVNLKSNSVRVFKAKNGVAIFCFEVDKANHGLDYI